jgi:AraC-like DNA-binding protein
MKSGIDLPFVRHPFLRTLTLVGAEILDHDCAAAAPDQDATAVLGDALSRLRLTGAIFLRGEYTEAWGYESLPAADAAAVLAPDAAQVVLFHVVATGRCWVEVDGLERHWANAGDVVVLPYNDQHRMGGTQPAECVSVAELIDPPPWTTMPVIRHGAGGQPTTVICGYLACDDPLFDRRMRVFPPLFVVTPPPGPARDWVRSSIEYAVQQTVQDADGRFASPTSIPELLLLEVLKLHLASAPAADRGWVQAMRDPVLAPALAALHAEPDRKWTVAELAREANASTSLLDERFRDVLGLAPIRYLAGWRMHLAEDLLRSTDHSVVAVARCVGYDSEEAFSRAFKRAHGQAPSVWRVQRPR